MVLKRTCKIPITFSHNTTKIVFTKNMVKTGGIPKPHLLSVYHSSVFEAIGRGVRAAPYYVIIT